MLSREEVNELVGPVKADEVDRFNHFGYGYVVTGLQIAKRLNAQLPEKELERTLVRQARLKQVVWSLLSLRDAPRLVRKTAAHTHRDEIENALIHSGIIAKEIGNKRLGDKVQKLLTTLKSLHGQKGYLDEIRGAVGTAYVSSRQRLLKRLGEKGPAFERVHNEAQGHLQELLKIKQPLRL